MSTSITQKPPSRPSRRAAVAAAAVGVVALSVALMLGPRPPAVSTQRNGDPQLSAHLAELAETGHRNLGAFTIVDGETTYAGLGADEHTEFEIGSVTKTFTAEILRNQIAAGRVSLDTQVGEIIDAGNAPVADVTLGELADHTSGLPRLGGVSTLGSVLTTFTAGNPYQSVSREDVLDAALDAETGGRGEFAYSNLGVALLGQLLSIEAETPYENLVRAQILDPLGMSGTYLMTDGSVPEDAPRGLVASGREAKPWEMGAYNPAGGVRSTPHDMARYAEHLLRVGVPGFAWRANGSGHYSHNGATYGFSTMLIIDPDTNRAAFVASDTATGVEGLTTALFDEEN